MEQKKFSTFVKEKAKLYFIDAISAMALGLFASLLIGTIFGTLGKYTEIEFLNTIETYAKSVTGAAIGVAIALAMKMPMLVTLSAAAVGAMGNGIGAILLNENIIDWAATAKGAEGIFYPAGPAGAFFAVIVACEIGKLVSKKTKVDILVTPVVTILSGFAASWLVCPLIAYIMYYLGVFITTATYIAPLFMGIVISVVVGIILTLPISSAAICSMIFSDAALAVAIADGKGESFLLAGGAAVAGCCAQMVGFAVMSFKENKWGGLVSQGLGTSMLQMSNIIKNPLIWIPPTLASAITGPLSTMLFKLECKGVAAGMGTCGFVGPLGIIDTMNSSPMMWIGILLVCIVLPAILSLIFCEIMRKFKWIKSGDLTLPQ